MRYAEFLERKSEAPSLGGKEPDAVSDVLYDFQAAIVRWAVRRGSAAVFADCGLGKTLVQLEWARQMGGRSLIVAPLAVTHQTIGEATKLGMEVGYVTSSASDIQYQITNYERLHNFDPSRYQSIVLDESSILKSIDGKTKRLILDKFTDIPHRLACTATPAPNDLTELGNHAEFVRVMSFREMSASFFVKESNGTRWRLKGHAKRPFYRWMSTWAVYVLKPSDIGFDDGRFELPPLDITDSVVYSGYTAPGRLFPGVDGGVSGRILARKSTIKDRSDEAQSIIDNAPGQWIVWCGLNDEGREIKRRLGDDAVLIEGSDAAEVKIERCNSWLDGSVRVLISKPSIFGFGMNFQNCHQVLFLGLGDSYEQYYQAIRRCWRFGQSSAVRVVIIVTEAERDVLENVRRKESQASSICREVISHLSDFETREIKGVSKDSEEYKEDTDNGVMWNMMLGDSSERLSEVEDDSVGLSVFSPPFVSLYTYTATERDIGNSKDEETFWDHFSFVIEHLLRVTMPGRNCCVHVSQIPAMLVRDGYIGMRDFRAETVRRFTSAGFIYHGEVVIDKDPQAQAIRTKSKGLMFVQLEKDASWMRPALADYILVFRKPGQNTQPIQPELSREEWIQWARPVWYGIRESDTLNFREARSDKDERHICPLQLGTIERCIRLWSNRGDVVCSPFAGIGSEGYVAVKHGRRFIGCELKEQYYRCATDNLRAAERVKAGLFSEQS